jgi:hypothetical protein
VYKKSMCFDLNFSSSHFITDHKEHIFSRFILYLGECNFLVNDLKCILKAASFHEGHIQQPYWWRFN